MFFREYGGLPYCNDGSRVTEARLEDPSAVNVIRLALNLAEEDGSGPGGLLEYLIFDFPAKYASRRVVITARYSVNPPI
jgi:hypothetical protein